MTDDASAGISALSSENRTFPPSEATKQDALVTGHVDVRRGRRGLPGVLGQAGRRAARLGHRVGHHLRVGAALRQVVRRRQAQRRPQLPRPPRRRRQGRQGRHPLRGRARRHPHDHLRRAARRGAALRQRAQGPRRRAGRPGQHLPADDPRGGRGDARLRPHRRRPQRRVRRVLVAGARRSDQRRRGQGADHGRRRVAPRCGVPAEAGRRRGAGARRPRSSTSSSSSAATTT